MKSRNVSPFATLAMFAAIGSGLGMGMLPARLEGDHGPEPIQRNDPPGYAPWLAQNLPPLDVPKQREPKEKRRSKAERKQRRKKRAQRSKLS